MAQSQSVSKALTTEVTEKEESDEEDPDKTLTLLPDEIPEDSPSIKVRSYHSGRDDSLHSTSDVISPPKSPASLTEGSFDYEKDPVMSSTMVSAFDFIFVIAWKGMMKGLDSHDAEWRHFPLP